MEFYVFKIHLCHLKYITGVCQEHIASLSILCHILIFTFFEGFNFCRIIAFHNRLYKDLPVPSDKTHYTRSTNDTE